MLAKHTPYFGNKALEPIYTHTKPPDPVSVIPVHMTPLTLHVPSSEGVLLHTVSSGLQRWLRHSSNNTKVPTSYINSVDLIIQSL